MSQQPFQPSPQEGLVAHLEAVLERARAGEVQFYVGSACVTLPENAAELDVQSFAAIGPRVPRWAPPQRAAVYATTLGRLAGACIELEKGMGPLKAKALE